MLRNVAVREKFTFRTSSRPLTKATKAPGKHNFDDPSCLSEPESSVEHPGYFKVRDEHDGQELEFGWC